MQKYTILPIILVFKMYTVNVLSYYHFTFIHAYLRAFNFKVIKKFLKISTYIKKSGFTNYLFNLCLRFVVRVQQLRKKKLPTLEDRKNFPLEFRGHITKLFEKH